MSYVWAAEKAEVSTERFPLLQIEAVSKSFHNGRALRNVSLKIGYHEIVGLVGPSRSGKTTALDLVEGRIKPGSGRIMFAGRDLADLAPELRASRGIARCHEAGQGFEDLTALQTVLLGAPERQIALFPRRGGKPDREAGLDVLARVGLEALADRPVAALCPLQRRLLAIAAALAGEPQLLLLDDPTCGLTPPECAMLAAVMGGVRDDGVSILMAMRHMPIMLAAICDRVVTLRAGEITADDMPSRLVQSSAALAAG
ncbi:MULTISPECIES: ATP-binding cassette domain-containing protein [Rhodomicrobium]|uniref:ATP-binding cassette domain-containing protein n=1 Tax=Rhodomicrobium TaxID=1068 RepID=UPI0014835864|nr:MULTISPECIES: ATP-binding cassette domain-containing protein [Rhodomicrobium]